MGLEKPRVSHRRRGLQWWTEVRELMLNQDRLSIKTPLLTHCDKSSSFVRSLGITLYNSALPFSPDYCGSQHLLFYILAGSSWTAKATSYMSAKFDFYSSAGNLASLKGGGEKWFGIRAFLIPPPHPQ